MFRQLNQAHQFLKTFEFPSDGQRQICSDKYQGVLEDHMVQEIVKKTTYLTWTQIHEGVRKCVQDFDISEKFWIYLPVQISSQLIMLADTWDLWAEKLPEGFISVKSHFFYPEDGADRKEMDIVIIDDWSLTGTSITSIVDNFQYDHPHIHFKFHVLVPYMTEHAQKCIQKMAQNVKFYTLDESFSLEKFEVTEEWYHEHISRVQGKYTTEFFEELGDFQVLCIFSDLKIPHECCCPRSFYRQTVAPEPFNLKKEIQKFFPQLESTPM